MAELDQFDATDVPPAEAYKPIPSGVYKALVVASEVKDTKAGTGKYLSLEWLIIEGEYENRKIFQNINLSNPNQTCVDIGKRELSAICHGIGKMKISDSNELHDIPVWIKVKIRPARGDYAASNEIASVKSLAEADAESGQSPAPAPAKPVATRTAAAVAQKPVGTKAPPWKR